MISGMRTYLALLLGSALLWLAAGLVADGLSAAPTTPRLRRRAGTLLLMVCAGVAGTGAAIAVILSGAGPSGTYLSGADLSGAGAGSPGGEYGSPLAAAWPLFLLPVLSAVVVAGRTVRRLRRLRAGAKTFATAPDAPVPPAMRAAAAHPLVVFPVQLAALAMLPASGAAAGVAAGVAPLANPGTLGPVLTTIVLVAVAIGVRHGLRHSRLKERAVTLRPTVP